MKFSGTNIKIYYIFKGLICKNPITYLVSVLQNWLCLHVSIDGYMLSKFFKWWIFNKTLCYEIISHNVRSSISFFSLIPLTPAKKKYMNIQLINKNKIEKPFWKDTMCATILLSTQLIFRSSKLYSYFHCAHSLYKFVMILYLCAKW